MQQRLRVQLHAQSYLKLSPSPSSPYKELLRSKQIKLGEKTKSRAVGMSVKKSDRRELHKGKRAPANEKARQPLADSQKKRPGSGSASVYRCIYCNEVYKDPPTEGWLQCPELHLNGIILSVIIIFVAYRVVAESATVHRV